MAVKIYILCISICIIPLGSSDTGYFWHVTDFHYDFSYHDMQLSCTHRIPDNAGEFGEFWCDSPWSLVNSSVHAMANIKPDVDFVLWTGDTVLHAEDKDLNYTINAGILNDTTAVLRAALPGVPIYATFGNHDYWPNNQFPPTNNALYNDTLGRWKEWIANTSQSETFRKGGYYTIKTQHGLRVIALNTNLYYTSNKAVLKSSDPADQLAWLNSTLAHARNNQEKVLVTAHIPPGVHTPNGIIWMHDVYHTPFVSILMEFTDVIVGMHFGHDHADGFKVLKKKKGQAAPIFIAPSVTPWRYKIPNKIGPAHNPGIRLVKYNRNTGVHIDIEQYYLDLVKANRDGQATWGLEYMASTHYGLQSLTANDLLNLVEKMKTASSKEFINFWNFYTVSPPAQLKETCDDDCHSSNVCGFTEFDLKAFQSCKDGITSNAWTHSNLYLLNGMFIFVFHCLSFL